MAMYSKSKRFTVHVLILSLLILTFACSIGVCQEADNKGEIEHLKPNTWFLRVTNPSDAGGNLCARIYFNPNRLPWYGDTLFVGTGGKQKEVPQKHQWLSPGQSSDWIDIGVHMPNVASFSGKTSYLSPVFVGTMNDPENKGLRITVELATGADKRLVRKIDVSDTNPTFIGHWVWLNEPPKLATLGLLIPVDPESGERIWTLEEAAEQQLEWLKSYGPSPKPSKFIHFISIQSQIGFKNPSFLQKMQAEIVNRLGHYNLTNYAQDREDIKAIKAMGVEPLPAKIFRSWDARTLAKDMQEAGKKYKDDGVWEYVRTASFGDEIDVTSVTATPEEQDAAFVRYLKSKGFKPLDFIRPEDEASAAEVLDKSDQWSYVSLRGPLPKSKPKLLYEAAVFRYKLWAEEFAKYTLQAKSLFPKGVQTGANFSPHMSVWPDVRKWINMIKDGGMTMPWAEDWWWQVPEASPQSYGFIFGALRRAADYHKSPICFYTIPDVGETSEHLLRMNYFALGNQVKILDHFAIYHQAFGTCDYVDFLESKEKFRVIHRVTTDVGRIDERLYRARMRPAEVAILLSKANDVWNTENLLTNPDQSGTNNLYNAGLNVDNHERKAIWLALRHAQIPVDVITDDDVIGGMLPKYKVIYLVGQEIQREAAAPIRQWVQKGGVLVSTGGGGLLDQYRSPIREMYDLYGLTDATLDRPIRTVGPANTLPAVQPLDKMSFTSGSLPVTPVLCYKQSLKPARQTSVIAKYTDGSPAAIERKSGKGKAVLMGGLPGLAYLQPAMTERKGHPVVMPEAYPEANRKLITKWPDEARISKHVITSDPLVEATLQEGPLGAVVTLTSFRNNPLKQVKLSFPGLKGVKTVTSLRHGKLKVSTEKGIPTVTVPVDQGDLLLVD